MAEQFKSVYQRGANTGFYFGLYLSALFFAMAYSMMVPGLSLLALVMMAAVPVIIYKCLRRMYVEEKGYSLLSGLWMYGIVIFFCGSLIAAAVSAIFLKWIHPGFMTEQIALSIDMLKSSGLKDGESMAEMLQLISDKGMIPGPAEVSIRTITFSVFTGSILSLIMAALAMARGYKR